MDVRLDPVKDFSLVEEAGVDITIGKDLFASEESIGTDAVVEGYDDNVVVACVNQAVSIEIGRGEFIKSSALEEDEDRMSTLAVCWCKDIQEEAILAVFRVI